MLDLGLSPLRLSTYWDEVDRSGYGDLDWQVEEAGRRGRPVVLTVGMKAQGWPEFAIPERLVPSSARPGSNVAAGAPALREAVLELVDRTVRRYAAAGPLVAWQVENEPLNPSGPRRWWIGPDLVRAEIAAARGADSDPGRPIVVNAFARFDRRLDVAASRHGPLRLLPVEALCPEAETLSLLAPGDLLGLDVYRGIGGVERGRIRIRRARHWQDNARHWVERSAATGREAWVIEAQAEPWEPAGGRSGKPSSCRPEDVPETVLGLQEAGCRTVVLWGAEHWLAAAAGGDDTWLRVVCRTLDATTG